MIIEWFLDLVMTVVDWFFSLFEGWELPDLSPPDELLTLYSVISGSGVWVPWAAIALSVGSVIGVWVVMFIVKVIRQLLAHVPLFGGAG